MLTWKSLILGRIGLFIMIAILGMSSGLTGRSAKISSGFMIFCLVNQRWHLGTDV